MFATLRAVRRWRAVSDRPSVGHERVWGPVSAAEAAKAGSARPAVSVVIKPRIEPCFAQAAMQCIPADVLPRACDTKEELVARLGASVVRGPPREARPSREARKPATITSRLETPDMKMY